MFTLMARLFRQGREAFQRKRRKKVSQAGSATSAQTMSQQRFADVPDTAYYAEAVNVWIMLEILNFPAF
ncbi:hypothetical protein [Paenibacillus sp. YIM B09110]|uniref:hypothetical protein n=1 Tax=Paenibacillus sp. YIM B09110 TaxID=3126102 RepID=UPI00301B6CC2